MSHQIPRILILLCDPGHSASASSSSWSDKHQGDRGWVVESSCDPRVVLESVLARGGVVVDCREAVSPLPLYCIEPLDVIIDSLSGGFMCGKAESLFEGIYGFCPGHPLVKACLERVTTTPSTTSSSILSGASDLLARFRNVTILPPYTFQPEVAGRLYLGHAKIYASIRPDTSLPATRWVSLLICSLDAPSNHLRPCLESIMHQTGEFGIEVVWINDGSSPHHTRLLIQELTHLERFSRRLCVSYHQNERNMGVAASLRKGLALCSHDTVFRMDADDVMEVYRMRTQLQFMDAHPETVLVGGQMQIFADGFGQSDKQNRRTGHCSWTAEAYAMRSSMPAWIVNHPTMCFRRDAILAIGSYRSEYNGVEDLDLVLRVMLQYGHFHNMGSVLVRHRRHRTQVTHRIEKDTAKLQRRAKMQIQLIDAFKKNYIALKRHRQETAASTPAHPRGRLPFPTPRR